MKDSTVYVSSNGRKLSGWTSVKITAKMEAIARAFDISYTVPCGSPDPLKAGDPVEVMIGEDLVLTGWITKTSTGYTSKTLTRTISGASRTVDLGDCCLPKGAEKQYRNLTPRALLESVCANYGIDVVDQVGKTDSISVNFNADGKIFDGLKKILLKNSLLITDDERGRLVIASSKGAASASDPLRIGENVLSWERTEDFSGVFEHYGVLGNGTDAESKKTSGEKQVNEWARSASACRGRSIVVLQRGNATKSEAMTRAENMKARAEAQARTLKCSVHGWRQSNGELWRLNSLVYAIDPAAGTREKLLITEISYTMDASGQRTQVTCRGADAFAYTDEPSQEAANEKAKKSEAASKVKQTAATRYTAIKSTKADWTTK